MILYILLVLFYIYNRIKEREKQKYVRDHTVIIREKKWLNV